jgi:hypothetical protein
MSLHQMTGLTPHLTETDLRRLEGYRVLGEPLELLMGAALRLRLVSLRDGWSEVVATMTDDEADALRRAMDRVVAPSDDLRLVKVVRLACRAADDAVTMLLAQPA